MKKNYLLKRNWYCWNTSDFTKQLLPALVLSLTSMLFFSRATAQCTPISSFPFTEGFEAGGLPNCWQSTHVDIGENEFEYFDWQVVSENMNEDNPLLPYNGNGMAQAFQEDYGAISVLSTPAFNLTGLTSPYLRFRYANQDWQGDYDILGLFYKTSANGEWIELNGIYIEDPNEDWQILETALPNPSATYYIGFAAMTDYGYGFNIDDVWVGEEADPATCLAPSGISISYTTISSVDFSWVASSTEAQGYQYSVTTSNTPPTGSGTFVSTASATVENLSSNTTYYVFVRTVCIDGSFSPWLGSIAFGDLPPNPSASDLCANAPTITCSNAPYTGTTVGATNDNMPLCGYGVGALTQSSPGVWYVFEGTGDLITTSLCGSQANFDTRINVYTGNCGNLTCFAGNDDNMAVCGNDLNYSHVSFQTTLGVTYYILIHGWQTNTGSYQLTLTCAPSCQPATNNDDCSGAVALTVQNNQEGPFTLANNQCALPSTFVGGDCGNQWANKPDVFFTFNSGNSTAVEMTVSNLDIASPAISGNYFWTLHSGNCLSNTYLSCGTINLNSITSMAGLTASTNYILRVFPSSFGEPFGTLGNFNIKLVSAAAPANDDCANAIAFPEILTDQTCATINTSTVGATGTQDQTCSGNEDDDVWFTFTVPTGYTSLLYTITSLNGGGTGTDRALQILDACNGTSLGCYDPESGSLTGLVGGNTYYLRAYTFQANVYSMFSICLRVPPPPHPNDEPCTAFELPVSGECNYITATNAGATNSANSNIPAPGCASYSGGDVWFKVTVPANGRVIVDGMPGSLTDCGMAIYSGNLCDGLLTLIECDDDDSENGAMPRIDRSGLVPGSTLYIRWWEYGNDAVGTFGICATTPCTAPGAPTVTVSGNAATATWTSAGAGAIYNWEVRTSGAAGSGPDGLVQNGTTDVNVLSVIVEDLDYASPYNFYVSTNCGEGVTSAWSTVVQFTTEVLSGCTDPEACNYNADAMVDDDSCIMETTTLYADADGDGYGDAQEEIENCGDTLEGYVLNNTDCDDTNADIWQSSELYIDPDGDGYAQGQVVVCYGLTIPDGHSETTEGDDCDDDNAEVWQFVQVYFDGDGDGYTTGIAVLCMGDSIPDDLESLTLESNGQDCNDEDPNVWEPSPVEVSLTLPVTTVCDNSVAFALTGGSPSGGTWSGEGITAGQFNPAGLAAPASYEVTYSVDGIGFCVLPGSATASIEVDDCTINVDEVDQNQIKLYPTFTSNYVTVDGIGLKVAIIMDANGKRHATVSLFNNSIIDMQGYAAGIYFIQVKGNITTQMFRVVKVN